MAFSWKFLLNFFFPRLCLGCGRWGRYFCPNCVLKIQYIKKNICPVCERPAVGGATHPACQSRYSLDGFASIFAYQGIIREAICLLKYKKVRDLLPEFTSLIVRGIRVDHFEIFHSLNKFIFSQKPLFVPLPLHWWRRRTRWFNQAEILGEPIANFWKLELKSAVLKRVKLKTPQVKLKGRERRENIKGVFRINSNSLSLIRHSSFLLFDDVWTTGSSLTEACRVLKRAGAKKIWGLTVAR